jgi:hypothetical protein
MDKVLLITRQELLEQTSLNGNIDVDKFVQYIYIAQQLHIQNFLGTKLFNKLIDDIKNKTLAEPYTSLLNDYVKPMVIHWSMVEFLPWAAYSISNKGIYKHGSENSTNAEKNEIVLLIEKERDIAEHYTRRFQDYICNKASMFPEYNSNSSSDMYPDSSITSFSGWYL